MYLSSADGMERNLFKRVEIAFPITDPELFNRVKTEGLLMPLQDNTQSWVLNEKGSYQLKKTPDNKTPYSVQQELLKLFANNND